MGEKRICSNARVPASEVTIVTTTKMPESFAVSRQSAAMEMSTRVKSAMMGIGSTTMGALLNALTKGPYPSRERCDSQMVTMSEAAG